MFSVYIGLTSSSLVLLVVVIFGAFVSLRFFLLLIRLSLFSCVMNELDQVERKKQHHNEAPVTQEKKESVTFNTIRKSNAASNNTRNVEKKAHLEMVESYKSCSNSPV